MSLLSLTTLAAMFMVFFLLMPIFSVSVGGKIFVAVWTLIGLLSFFAHGRSMKFRDRRQCVPIFGIQKNERTSTKARSTSFVGGS